MSQNYYGLPKKVLFCKKTLMSNQRPASTPEFKHTLKSKKKTLYIDKNGISETWKFSRLKKKINFKHREGLLLKLLDKHRGKHGKYDCIVPGSGGKDSCYAAHVLKYKYGMNPLTVTWPPILYTDYGYKNFKNWISSGNFENISAKRNEKLMKIITKYSILNLMHPFQSFILGQKNFAPKIALKYKIPLIFYGESESEHGSQIKRNFNPTRESEFFSTNDYNNIYLAGMKFQDIMNDFNFKFKDMEIFLPINQKDAEKINMQIHYLGYYLNWVPQETFYYSVNKCNFRPRPFRTQGTYSRYNSIDDKIDDLHYYTTFIKFGIGRTTYDVSQELRNDHLNIEEGKKLIKKYDGEFPDKYFSEIMKYLNISESLFLKLCNKFRPKHIWKKKGDNWLLRHTANYDGTDD